MTRNATLLERGPQLDELAAVLDRVVGGAGALVMVAGEAGVGKSALIRAFLARAADRADVAVGACDPLSTPRPLGPLLDVAPVLGGGVPAAVAEGNDREAILRSVLSALRDRARPLVWVVEDVHWADEATLDLVQLLGRRAASARALLIVSYRNDELGRDHPLRRVLGTLATVAAVTRLRVEPLTERGVGELAEGSGRRAAELWRRTGGNPFFVTEVLASEGTSVPDTVRDAVLARAGALSARGRRVLEAASVVGARVEPWLLSAMLGGDPAGLDACVASGMLVEDPVGLAFRHDLAREAVAASIPPARRAALHRAAFSALREAAGADRPDAYARLAHHADGAGDAAAVLQFAPAAGRHAAALRAHREAAAQYARALRYGAALTLRERAELLDARAYECYLTNDMDGAMEARREAWASWRGEGDTLREGDDLRWLSRLSWFVARRGDALRTGREAVEVLERRPPSLELAWAYSNLSQLAMLADDVPGAVRWGERAMRMGEAFGSAEVRSHALNNMGTALYTVGREGGRERLLESLELARSHAFEEHVARAYTNLASVAVRSRDLERAENDLRDGLAYCADHDLDAWWVYLQGWRALVLLHRGRWNQATGVVADLTARPDLPAVSRCLPLVVLGSLRARRGDAGADAALDEAASLAAAMDEPQRSVPVAVARAEAAWLRGAEAPDVASLERLARRAVAIGDAWAGGETAYWYWKLTGVALPLEGLASPFAAQLAGRWREAAAAWSRLGYPYEAARALAEGDTQEALHRAYRALEGLGARAAMDRVTARLRRLGLRGVPTGPRRATRANPAQLTPRQFQVLELLAEGLSDAEIASRLHRSVRTVGHHVSAVLAKLEVENRTQAVRTAMDRGYLGTRGPGDPTSRG